MRNHNTDKWCRNRRDDRSESKVRWWRVYNTDLQCSRAQQLGAKVVAMYDSNGYIYDPNGIQLDVIKQIKEAAAAVK